MLVGIGRCMFKGLYEFSSWVCPGGIRDLPNISNNNASAYWKCFGEISE